MNDKRTELMLEFLSILTDYNEAREQYHQENDTATYVYYRSKMNECAKELVMKFDQLIESREQE